MEWMKYASKSVNKYQMGGEMPAEGGAPQGAPAGDPAAQGGGGGGIMEAIMQAAQAGDAATAQQVLQAISQDPNASLEIVTMIAQVAGGGGEVPAEGGAPEGGAPMARNGMQMRTRTRGPVFNI